MGLFAALLSAVFSSSKDLMSKRLASRLDGTVSTFASFAFAVPFYLLLLGVLQFLGYDPFASTLTFVLLVVARAVTDTFAEWMKMHALAHGDLSVVSLFFSLSPIFLLVTSPLITRVPLKRGEIVAVVLVVIGSILMVYGPSAHGWAAQKKGILLAIGASVFFSLNSCFDYLAVRTDGPDAAPSFSLAVLSGFTMTLLSAVFLAPFVLGSAVRRGAMRTHSFGFLVRGFLEISFMVCKLYAMQFLTAPEVVGFQRISLLLSIVGGRIFFKEKGFARKLAAGVLILAGAAVIAWMKLHESSPP